MSSDDELDLPNFRIKGLSSPDRKKQLDRHCPVFQMPPKTESYSSLNLNEDSMSGSLLLGSKSLSSIDLKVSSSILASSVTIDKNAVEVKFKSLHPSPPESSSTILHNILELKSLSIHSLLEETLLLPLSAILQSHRAKKALIIVPSNEIATWTRKILLESTALCPPERGELKKRIEGVMQGRIQALIAFPNQIRMMPLNTFDYILTLKTELFDEMMTYFSSYLGVFVFHYSPRFAIDLPFEYQYIEYSSNQTCDPVGIRCEENYSELQNLIKDPNTVIITAFKDDIDKVTKICPGKIERYVKGKAIHGSRAVVGTIAVLYSTYQFEHFIFVGFPMMPSLIHHACSVGKSCVVLVNTLTAKRIQSLAHGNYIDKPLITAIMQQMFWNGSEYRKAEGPAYAITGRMDVSERAFNNTMKAAINRKVIELIPFTDVNISVKVYFMSEKMQDSQVMNTILKGSYKIRGQYSASFPHIIDETGLSPLDIYNQLQQFEEERAITFTIEGNAAYVKIKTQLDDDSFMELVQEISSDIQRAEDKKHEEIDSIYKDLIGESIQTVPVKVSELKRMLELYPGSEWTPRAAARILHGVASPMFSPSEWSRTSFWNSQEKTDFREIMRLCQACACNPSRMEVQ